MILLNFKLFIKNKIIILTTAFLFYWITLYMFINRNMGLEDSVDLQLANMLKIIPVVFFAFMVISYEFFYQSTKNRLREVICASKYGKQKEFLTNICVVIFLDMIVSLYVFIACIKYYKQWDIKDKIFIIYTLRVIIIYIFLNMIVASFLGILAAQFSRRISGISALLCFYFLFSDTFVRFIMSLFLNNEFFSNIALVLALFYRSASAKMDGYYYLTAENTHIIKALFWIILCITIFCIKNKCKKAKKIILCAVTVIVCFVAMFPSGTQYIFYHQAYQDSWTHDQIYYNEFFGKYDTKSNYVNDEIPKYHNDFKALKYNITYDISDILNGKVEVIPDKNNLEEYKFTLYHGYKIKNITNENGEKLNYSIRGGDYVSISNKGKKVNKIIFEYSGYCRFFYSTTQAVNLPGGFAYYPIPGWHLIYNRDADGFDDSFKCNYLENNAEFNLKVRSGKKYIVKTNLSEHASKDGYQVFKGNSAALIMVGSPFMAEKTYDGVKFLYPKKISGFKGLNKEELEKGDVDEILTTLKKNKCNIKNKVIILSGNGQYQYSCITNSGIYGSVNNLAEYIEELKYNDERYWQVFTRKSLKMENKK